MNNYVRKIYFFNSKHEMFASIVIPKLFVSTRSMHFIRVVIFAGCFFFYLNFPKEKGLAAQ